MRKLKNILITGGAGFIGCNFIHYLFGLSNSGTDLFGDANFTGNVVNVDCLTYAGNLESLKDVEEKFGGKRYFFEKVDITDRAEIERIFKQYDIDTVIHYPDANTNCCSTNISFFPSNQISAIDISFEDLINQKRLYAEPMGNGMIQFQIESQEDILNASNFIQFVKNTMGTDIYNLTQIAKNRNLI